MGIQGDWIQCRNGTVGLRCTNSSLILKGRKAESRCRWMVIFGSQKTWRFFFVCFYFFGKIRNKTTIWNWAGEEYVGDMGRER